MRRAYGHDVAIHAPFAGKLYVPTEGRASGGAEFQMVKLAQTLADRGLSMCHIVFGYEGIDPHLAGPVDLVTQPPDEFDRNLVFYSHSIERAVAKANADVYIQRTAGFETGVVAAAAKARRRRFVFSSSSSTDLRANPPLPTWASRLAYRAGLRLANEVVVQTDEQVALAEQTMGRRPKLIRSFCEPVANVDPPPAREAFLWIGGLIDYKDPLAYVRLAERVPEANFWMIGTGRGADWEGLASDVEAAAEAGLPNLELLAPRSRESLRDLYARARSRWSTPPSSRASPTRSWRAGPPGHPPCRSGLIQTASSSDTTSVSWRMAPTRLSRPPKTTLERTNQRTCSCRRGPPLHRHDSRP